MVDNEVETILREIRERVRAEQKTAGAASARAAIEDSGNGSVLRSGESFEPEAAPLAHVTAYLTTTARAWDRLPPLLSNRSGAIARLELWIKRHLKRATRWYVWEQINFNAAVHHTLLDTLSTLRTYEQALEQLRVETDTQRTEIERQSANAESQRLEVTGRLTALAQELRERDQHLRERDERLLDEQRVCFKQLSLEANEASVLEGRAWRRTEALLDDLKRRIERLEKR